MQVAVLARKLTADLGVMMPVLRTAISHLREHPTKTYNVGTVVNRLDTAFTPYGVRVRRATDHTQCRPDDDMYFTLMGGECRFHAGFLTPRITVTIHHHPSTSRWSINTQRLRQLHHCFGRTLSHELIHRYQIIRRDATNGDEWAHRVRVFGDNEDQQYHGEYDEIEAYAHDIVQEFRQRYQGASEMSPYRLRKLVRNQFIDGEEDVLKGRFPSLWFYCAAFHRETSHPAVETLLKKVYSWAKHAPRLADYLQ